MTAVYALLVLVFVGAFATFVAAIVIAFREERRIDRERNR